MGVVAPSDSHLELAHVLFRLLTTPRGYGLEI